MERSKAIENLMRIRHMHDQRVFGAINDEEDEALAMAIEALEQAPTALDHIHNVVKDDAYRRGYEQGKADANHPEIPDSWVPVTERLPEIGELVLVCCMYGDGYKDQAMDFRAKDGNWWLDITFDDPDPAECCKVVAWMPLPEPYRKET